MRLLCFAIWLGAVTAALAGEPADYMTGVEACFKTSAKTGDLGCVGQASSLCQDSIEQGSSTLGISLCDAAETATWDAILNREYAAALAYANQLDTDDPSPAGNAAEIVKKAERAWVGFRDAQCLMAYAGWGGGSMQNIASSDCRLRMTAERALVLYGWYQFEMEERP